MLSGRALWLWICVAGAAEAIKFSALILKATLPPSSPSRCWKIPMARLSASEAIALPSGGANEFAPATPDQLMRGFPTSAVWLRLSLVNRSTAYRLHVSGPARDEGGSFRSPVLPRDRFTGAGKMIEAQEELGLFDR